MADHIEHDRRRFEKYVEAGAMAVFEHSPSFLTDAREVLFCRELHDELEKARPEDRLGAIEAMFHGIFLGWLSPRPQRVNRRGSADHPLRLRLLGLDSGEIMRTLDYIWGWPATITPALPGAESMERPTNFPAAAQKVIRSVHAAHRIWSAAWSARDATWGRELADAIAAYVARELREHLENHPAAEHLDVAATILYNFLHVNLSAEADGPDTVAGPQGAHDDDLESGRGGGGQNKGETGV